MHLLIHDTLPESIKNKKTYFHHLNVSKELHEDASLILKQISEKDFFPDTVCRKLDNIEGRFDSITISLNEKLNWIQAVRLSSHIRFHNFKNHKADFPIIITADKLSNLILDANTKGAGDIQNFQYEDGFFFKRFDELFQETMDEAGEIKLKFDVFYNEELYGKQFAAEQLEIIKINSKDHGDRHSIANQWGAIKLALNSGYTKEDIQYDWPPTLYFKYLLKKHESQITCVDERQILLEQITEELNSIANPKSFLSDGKFTFSNHPYLKNKKILLIDDNADKGWEVILRKIFGTTVNSVYTVLDTLKISDYKDYDLVFLDLYLPNPKKGDIPDMAYSKRILEDLKKGYPHIPIIIFTASNKSWTLNEVNELGADGMYVKESPEYAGDKKYSKENFESFVKTVIKTLDAYTILRPYWERIEQIKRNFLPEISNDNPNRKFKARIEERLDMFYGLLKRGLFQRKYDEERFFFSDYELAFMTLWSVLNEISEAYFEKSQPSIVLLDRNNNSISNHPGGKLITYRVDPFGNSHYQWKIKNQPDIFVEYQYYLQYDSNNNIRLAKNPKFYYLNWEQQSRFTIASNSFSIGRTQKTKINYEKTLYLQIAYLMEKKKELRTSTNAHLHQHLLILNELRNHLYLTHGSEISHGFYSRTEKENRDNPNHRINPNGKIKELFELIAFLLSGKEMKIQF